MFSDCNHHPCFNKITNNENSAGACASIIIKGRHLIDILITGAKFKSWCYCIVKVELGRNCKLRKQCIIEIRVQVYKAFHVKTRLAC